jgi:hypothetical protein
MKTIEVSDEMYDQLVELATEMVTQDPSYTAMPHLFQIQTEKKVYDWSCNGHNKVWIDVGNQIEIETYEDLVDYFGNMDKDVPENLKEMWDDMFQDDLEYLFEKELPDLEQCSYTVEHVYENGFLTAKACDEHIRKNGNYYDNPRTYLAHAWRNTDMDLVSEFLCALVGKPIHK